MIMSLVLFENEFLNIVSISFTALILNELIMVALEITTWLVCDSSSFLTKTERSYRHVYMVISEVVTFFLYALSLVMEDQFEVRLKLAMVKQRHKNLVPEIEEDVGQAARIICVLSTRHYQDGYRPSNREMKELQQMLMNRKPCWWEAA